MRMRRKLVVHAAVLLIAVFAMSANAFCAELCAGGHGHDHGGHSASADKNGPAPAGSKQGHEAHSCHHYAPPAAKAAPRHHDGHEKAEPHACHAKGHKDEVQSVSANVTKSDKSTPVIECNCMDESGAFAPETEAPVTFGAQPSPATDIVSGVAAEKSTPFFSDSSPPETPPKIVQE